MFSFVYSKDWEWIGSTVKVFGYMGKDIDNDKKFL